ncbi:hypothetical protein BRC74_06805 [Halobacteriales archaeon QH_7_68_42]|nr:MAG: hypothetical protein BRC74_06805 [Halobacteriales archaeon QH_7_68_42]
MPLAAAALASVAANRLRERRPRVGAVAVVLLLVTSGAYATAGGDLAYTAQPRFLRGEGRPPTWRAMLRVGTRPRTMQYGDPQDMGVNQYTVILERTGECNPEATSPLRSDDDGN